MTFCFGPRKSTKFFLYFVCFSFVLRISRWASFSIWNAVRTTNCSRYSYTELTEENENLDFFLSVFSFDRSFFFLRLAFIFFFSISFLICLQFFERRSFAVYYFIHFTSAQYWIIWLSKQTERVWFYGSMVLIPLTLYMYWCDHHTSAHRHIETTHRTNVSAQETNDVKPFK